MRFKSLPIGVALISASLCGQGVYAAEEDIDKAREALAKQEDEGSEEKLEEVFEQSEKSYSLVKKGKSSLNYAFSYSFFGDQALDVQIENGNISNFDVNPSSRHTLTNAFTVEYGLLDNVTLSVRTPVVFKADTQDELEDAGLGDISSTLRWQPFAYVPGKMTTTFTSTFTTKTGRSPYEIRAGREISFGSGTYSLSFGANASKVMDPVVLFGSLSFQHSFAASGLNQVRGSQVLKEVRPGETLSASMGFSYSLSYDVSLSTSFSTNWSGETEFDFNSGTSKIQDQVSSVMNFSLGIRATEKKLVNVNVGMGLTEDSPDFVTGFSMPIDIAGLKPF